MDIRGIISSWFRPNNQKPAKAPKKPGNTNNSVFDAKTTKEIEKVRDDAARQKVGSGLPEAIQNVVTEVLGGFLEAARKINDLEEKLPGKKKPNR